MAIGPQRLAANAITERQRLISMSARGRLPTSNTFELIRKWKLVKEEEEKQQQSDGRSRHCSPDCHKRDWKTHRPALAHRCDRIKALYVSTSCSHEIVMPYPTSIAAPEHEPMSSSKLPCCCTKCLKSQLHTTELLTRLSSPCSAVKASTLCCLLMMQLL